MDTQRQALARLVELLASADPDVLQWRDKTLKSKTLSDQEATRWLRSNSGELDPPVYAVVAPLDRLEEAARQARSYLETVLSGRQHGARQGETWLEIKRVSERITFNGESIDVNPTSPAWQAVELAKTISKRYQVTLEAALQLVLTGSIDPRHLELVQLDQQASVGVARTLSTLTVHIRAWATGKTVARAVATWRKELLARRQPRPPAAKNLQLAVFVIDRLLEGQYTWDSLRKAWNSQAPRPWRFKDVGNFRRQAVRAVELWSGLSFKSLMERLSHGKAQGTR